MNENEIQSIIHAAESLDWSVFCSKQKDVGQVEYFTLELERFSPSGEDFFFIASGKTSDEIIEDITDYARNFDTEDHITEMLIAKRNGLAGVPDVHTLVGDADEIFSMLCELSDALQPLRKGE